MRLRVSAFTAEEHFVSKIVRDFFQLGTSDSDWHFFLYESQKCFLWNIEFQIRHDPENHKVENIFCSPWKIINLHYCAGSYTLPFTVTFFTIIIFMASIPFFNSQFFVCLLYSNWETIITLDKISAEYD